MLSRLLLLVEVQGEGRVSGNSCSIHCLQVGELWACVSAVDISWEQLSLSPLSGLYAIFVWDDFYFTQY